MRKRKSRKIAAGMAVCIALTAALSGCSESAEPEEVQQEEASVAVSAKTPQVGDLSVSGTYIGTVSPEEQVNIIPLVSGEVTEVNFEVGDYVEAGSVLVRIDDEAARLQLESAQLSREGAELSAQRTLGSTQVMNNLSMESNINSIQYQIDMARKQYEAAGDSVSDAYEAKDDMQEALDKINNSIGDMEDGYNDMRRMAVAAKNLVKQNKDSGVWEWIIPDDIKWEEVYYTSQEEEDEAMKNPAAPEETPTVPSTTSDENDKNDTTPSDGSGSSNQQNGSGNETKSPVKAPGTGTSAGVGDLFGPSAGEEEKPDQPESGNDTQETTEPDAGTGSGSSDESESSTESPDTKTEREDHPTEGAAETESFSQSDRKGTGETQESTDSQSRSSVAERKVYQLSDSGTDESFSFGMDEIRRHVKPWEERTAQKLQAEGNGGYRVVAVTAPTDPDAGEKPPYKLPYAAYRKAREAAEAISKLKAAGYSPADIGEGRMDSSVANYATQIASLKSQAATLESNIKSMDSNISSAETSRSTTADSIDFYEDNLKNAQIQYGIQNGQAYEDTAAALANQIASTDVGIASARMQLENYVLTAPISGYIEQKNVDDFGMVSAGNPVYVISNKDSMTVTFYVSEAVRDQMSVGRPLTLERAGQTLTAAVTRVGQSVDARTGLFEIRATVENSDLANGVTVKVYAQTAGTTNALLIPYDAVYYEENQAYVYCVQDDILQKTPVETGIYDEDTIEITGGLTKDSVVVNTWSSRLADGIRVHLVE